MQKTLGVFLLEAGFELGSPLKTILWSQCYSSEQVGLSNITTLIVNIFYSRGIFYSQNCIACRVLHLVLTILVPPFSVSSPFLKKLKFVFSILTKLWESENDRKDWKLSTILNKHLSFKNSWLHTLFTEVGFSSLPRKPNIRVKCQMLNGIL